MSDHEVETDGEKTIFFFFFFSNNCLFEKFVEYVYQKHPDLRLNNVEAKDLEETRKKKK